ncbi:MAG: hypothetical protein ACOX8S_01175 [Christensenellales bacterium]|jgi:uncharacterized membrane protein YcgQ (UPF0703/DUF1980 family)
MKKFFAALLLSSLIIGMLASCSPPRDDDGFFEYPPAPDVDLTALSSTMVFAEVYNIMTNPDDYMGKTIKLSGQYYASYDELFKKYYHFIVIEDATACCQQGLEFAVKGETDYPQDYPPDGTVIELTGSFSSYDESGYTYYYISTDTIIVLQ